MNSKYSFASQLAKFLRLNGDQIIQGHSKLSLTTSALFTLNNIFDSVLFSTDGMKILPLTDDILNEEFFENVKFLFDFMRKTASVKIFHGGQTLRGGIDVSRFSNLTIIEFHKVPMHLVIGLNTLCPQLTTLVCHRSIYCLKEIFHIGESDRKLWIELRELNVAYNYLEGFDQSLGMLPRVEYIDASHNGLKHVDEIQMMEKLIFLNLSYNLLENVPILSGLSCRSIRVLFLRNNNLENLDGLEMLPALEELDVGNNCISEHSTLRSLKSLAVLKSLNLEGNPVFFHKRHRILTTRHLHSSVVSRGILLNRILMGPEEVLKTMRKVRSTSFYAQTTSTHQTAINVIIEGDDDRARTFSDANTVSLRVPPSNSEDTGVSSLGEGTYRNYSDSSDIDSLVHKSCKKRRRKKKKKQIAAVIEPKPSTHKQQENEEHLKNIPLHLQTKKELEIRRNQFKEGWLIPTPTFQICTDSNDVIINVPPNTPATGVPVSSVLANSSPSNDDRPIVTSEVKEKLDSLEKQEVPEVKVDVVEEETVSCEQIKEIQHEQKEEDLNGNIAYPTEDKETESSDEYEDDLESSLFLVETNIENLNYSLCLKIKENSIKEIDLMSSKVLDELDLRCLMSVILDKDSQESYPCRVCLHFDTSNSTRQKRIYQFDDLESAQTMYSVLKPFADAKTMEDTIIGALQCVKCGSQFSKEVAQRKVIKAKNPFSNEQLENVEQKDFHQETLACPNCGSTIVVEMETMPVPSAQLYHQSQKDSPSTKRKQESSDDSSKAKRNSPNTTQKIHPPKVRHSSIQSNQSSSIAVISDTESNLDAISEKNSLCSPLSSPTVVPQLFQGDDKNDVQPLVISSSVTESVGKSTTHESHAASRSSDCLDFGKLLEERESFSFKTFTIIEPEIFFYLDIELFDDDETLSACLQTNIVPLSSAEEFSGLLVISSHKLYIINSSNDYKTDVREKMKLIYSCSLKQLNTVCTLLGNQGFSISCGSDKTFVILVKDADLCNCFTSLLMDITNDKLQESDMPQFVVDTDNALSQVSTEVFSPSMNSNQENYEMLLYLFGLFRESEQTEPLSSCFVITAESMYVAKLQFKKQTKQKVKSALFQYLPIHMQKISDLIEVKIEKDILGAEIFFKDEEKNISSQWIISTRTKSALLSMINAFKSPWESVFSIELPLSFV